MRARPYSIFSILCTAALVLSACAAATPTPTPTSSPISPHSTNTPTATLQPTSPPPTATPAPTLEPTPTPALEYAQPAGCLSAKEQVGLSTGQMLAYADRLIGDSKPLADRSLTRAWNASTGMAMALGGGAVALDVNDIREGYRLQPMLDALHVAGFAAYLRQDETNGKHILAVSLNETPPTGWEVYASAYWTGELPAGDKTILPGLRLTPCDWMVASGTAPDLDAGIMEKADWSQYDLAEAGKPYLAEMTEDAFVIAYQIDWLEGGNTESPVTMCGPLAWSISTGAHMFPLGYGDWLSGPKSFWLPRPDKNGRPWSLFPPDTYTVMKTKEKLAEFDFSAFPLRAGDIIYTYSGGDGFDHVMVITEVDEEGRVYAVSNIILYRPIKWYSIQRILLYDPGNLQTGYFRDQWAKDFVNGRTGQKGFEVLRWNWRAKDIDGVDATYIVKPGDTLPLVAARWRTPPEDILRANKLEKNAPLSVGQVLVIPAIQQ